MQWAADLCEFDISYKPRTLVKGWTLADYIAEFTEAPNVNVTMEPLDSLTWSLLIDGTSGKTGSK